MDYLGPAITGFLLGSSLIIAIGPQNAFILRQGLLRQHVFILCLICALADALLIIIGVAGLGTLLSQNPYLITFAKWAGALFLFAYGIFAFRRALKPQAMGEGQEATSLKAAIATCLAFTFLNPHVYVDTVVVITPVSLEYEPYLRPAFAIGTIAASFVWFFAMGYGARLLVPLFAKPRAWQVLDVLIGVIMFAIAANLIFGE